jgi:hypothetical protein
MQISAEQRILRLRPNTYRPGRWLRMRDRSRPRDGRPANGTYGDRVEAHVDPAVARVRFGRFVDRALASARAGGMTDREIQRQSGVATSTFHRWKNAEGRTLPSIGKVRAFCEATGASFQDAMRALGMTDDAAPTPTPEPPLPREIQTIMRKLADPTTPGVERDFILMTLQMLAARRTASSSDDRGAEAS